MAGVNTLVGQSEERGALSLAYCASVPELQGARGLGSLVPPCCAAWARGRRYRVPQSACGSDPPCSPEAFT
jgi:hypothetical protein